jgi:hypothetical protein
MRTADDRRGDKCTRVSQHTHQPRIPTCCVALAECCAADASCVLRARRTDDAEQGHEGVAEELDQRDLPIVAPFCGLVLCAGDRRRRLLIGKVVLVAIELLGLLIIMVLMRPLLHQVAASKYPCGGGGGGRQGRRNEVFSGVGGRLREVIGLVAILVVEKRGEGGHAHRASLQREVAEPERLKEVEERLKKEREDARAGGHRRMRAAVVARQIQVEDVLAVAVRDEAAARVHGIACLVEHLPCGGGPSGGGSVGRYGRCIWVCGAGTCAVCRRWRWLRLVRAMVAIGRTEPGHSLVMRPATDSGRSPDSRRVGVHVSRSTAQAHRHPASEGREGEKARGWEGKSARGREGGAVSAHAPASSECTTWSSTPTAISS